MERDIVRHVTLVTESSGNNIVQSLLSQLIINLIQLSKLVVYDKIRSTWLRCGLFILEV